MLCCPCCADALSEEDLPDDISELSRALEALEGEALGSSPGGEGSRGGQGEDGEALGSSPGSGGSRGSRGGGRGQIPAQWLRAKEASSTCSSDQQVWGEAKVQPRR